MSDVPWEKLTAKDIKLIGLIVKRAFAERGDIRNKLYLQIDISATHLRKPLRLEDLLKADDFDFNQDIYGIVKHINRKTGELGNFFVPRFTQLKERSK